MKRSYFTLLCFVVFVFHIQAQYVFNSCANRPVFGDSLIGTLTQYDSLGISSGSAGANIAWNYSNLTLSGTVPISHRYADPSLISDTTATSTNLFPAANLADQAPNGVYSYYKYTPDSVSYFGDYRGASYYQLSVGPEKKIICPFSFGNSFHDFFAQYNFGMCTFNSFINKIVTYDAYGTLNLGSTSYNVARMKILEYTVDSSNCSPSPIVTYNEDTTYVWFDTNTNLPVFSWEYHNDTSNHYVTKVVESYSYSHIPVTLNASVQPIARQQSEIDLYPNPSNGIFILQANDLPIPADGQLEIYNVLGKKVSSDKGTIITNSVNGTLIKVNISGVQAGIYFLRLKTEQGMEVKKIIIK